MQQFQTLAGHCPLVLEHAEMAQINISMFIKTLFFTGLELDVRRWMGESILESDKLL